MRSRRTLEVLYETEAALRLVDHGLVGLRDEADDDDAPVTEDAAISLKNARDRAPGNANVPPSDRPLGPA